MKKVNNLKINKKTVYKMLKKKVKTSFMVNRINSLTFRIGRFVQAIRYNDKDHIDKMYYDFNRANLINKSFLLFIKESLLTQHSYQSMEAINEMLSIYQTNNKQIMSTYSNDFMNMLNNNKYSSIETSAKLTKTLKENKYITQM